MFLKNPKIRGFNYKPRFYNPDVEEEDEGGRIKFRRLRERKPVPKRSPLGMLIIIVILAFLVRYLITLNNAEKENSPMQEIKIEVVE
ncbi:hypothetical protein B6I21_02865 [candidate division KSB1 bacterium 4572_119]|nr:MAG: hypothetical protein B6I21_02865 [candidate division KSB1 bacterium 4572_119]